MITRFSLPVTGLFSSRGFRAVVVGVTSTWLSILAVSAPAQSTRPYQMSILASTDDNSTANVDIPIFTLGVFRHQLQPAGRSIVWLPPDANLDQYNQYLDWTRIVAVYVDEPYGTIVGGNHPSCHASPLVEAKAATLEAMAAAVRLRAPSARFWVNFTRTEIELIRDEGCPFNQPYIDVISMDIYDVAFQPTLGNLYHFLFEHRATTYQQLALVPGTFTGGANNQTGASGASRLSGFFAYAASMNQRCDLPLGPTGMTGSYDGCPVWMVAGWIGGVTPTGNYFPIDNPASVLVFNRWQTEFAVQRVDPARVRRTLELIPLWLND
jgi:hypothetical protein